MSSCDLDLNSGAVPRLNRNVFCQNFPGESFLRRADSQGAMRAVGVVPIRKVIQPALNGRGTHRQEHEPLPLLETFKKSFHPAIQKWTSHLRADVADTLPPHRLAELLAELAAVVGDDEFRHAMPGGRVSHQCGHIAGARCLPIDLQRQNLTRKSIENRRDEKRKPQGADLRDIAVPDVIGAFGFHQAIGPDTGGPFRRWPGLARRLFCFRFAQHTLHRGAADLDSCTQKMPGHGAGSEFRFRAEPSQFLRRPAHGVVDTIPHNDSGQQVRLAFALGGFDPGAERIFVDHEPLGGDFDVPVPQAHKLQNCQSLRGPVVGPAVRKHVFPPGTDNFQFSTQRFGFRDFMVPVDHQSQYR